MRLSSTAAGVARASSSCVNPAVVAAAAAVDRVDDVDADETNTAVRATVTLSVCLVMVSADDMYAVHCRRQ